MFHFLRLLYPEVCPFCGKELPYPQKTCCNACFEKLWRLKHKTCLVCGRRFLYDETAATVCADCRGHRFPYETIVAPLSYNAPVRSAILAYKYRMHYGHSRAFADLMVRALHEKLPNLCVSAVFFVPTSARRFAQRSFCPAEWLARAVAKKLKVPVHYSLKKCRDTPAQSAVSPEDRRRNLKDAFVCTASLTGQSVLLVDDVCTTGSTVKECAKALKKAGAAHVYVVVLARVEKPRGTVKTSSAL